MRRVKDTAAVDGVLLCGAVFKASAAEPILTPAPPIVCTFDLRPLNQLDLKVSANAVRVWDTLHIVAALQGLANSESPRLYLLYCDGFGVDSDQFWLDWFRGEDGGLRGTRIVPLGGDKVDDVVSVDGDGVGHRWA